MSRWTILPSWVSGFRRPVDRDGIVNKLLITKPKESVFYGNRTVEKDGAKEANSMCMKFHFSIYRATLLVLLPWLSFVSRAQDPTWEWARSFATNNYEIAKQVAVDTSTNHVYVVGDWEDDLSLTFPGGANPSTQFASTYGRNDGFVAKYDPDGGLVWAFKVGGENDDQVNSIALDRDGNIYITGMMGEGSSIYFSGSSPHTGSSTLSNTSDQDFFLAKYTPDGEFIWVRRSTTDSGDLSGQDVCLSSDAVYAVGNATDRASFGSLNMVANPDVSDIFLIKYSLDGTELWISEAGSDDMDLVNGVVADETHVYYIGDFEGENLIIRNMAGAVVNTEGNVDSGHSDIILAAYDQAGQLSWSQTIASLDHDEGWGITMDADSLYITGAIDDGASFPGYPGNPLYTVDHLDIFLASLARSDGNTGWVQVLPSTNSGDERGRCIDMDASGNLFLTGDYGDDLLFPAGITLSAIHDEDVFLAAYTANGTFRWAQSAGSDSHDIGYGLATGPGGSIYLAGRHDQEMTLGPLVLPEDGNNNGYLAKLQDAPPPPANNTPCAALLLPVGDTCSQEIYDNRGATGSGIPDPGCGAYAGSDVWFKLAVPSSGNLFIGTDVSDDDTYPPVDGWLYRAEMAVYSGSCGSMNLEGCFSANSGYSYRAASAYLFDRTPGDTLWVRIWEAFGNEFGNFSICAYDPGHNPAWDLPEELCRDGGLIDLDTTLKELTYGVVDRIVASSGVPDPGNAAGIPDAASARLFEDGDWMILDLTDTIPAGEPYLIYFRSYFLLSTPTSITLRVSQDNVDYVEHSFRPETDRDLVSSHYIVAEHPTRYVYIGNHGAGGGGFAVDAIEYVFRGTRGGTWSGPGVTGSIFDPAGLPGPVSLMYSVGGTSTRTDSIRTIHLQESEAGILRNDTTVCTGDHTLQLDLQGYSGIVLGWQSSVDGFISSTSIVHPDPFLTVSGLTQTTYFRAIVQEGSCDPDTSNTVTVTVVDLPVADPGPFEDMCGTSLDLRASLSAGTGTWSLVSGPGSAAFIPSENDPIVNVQVDQYGAYTFSWTENNGICSDDSVFTVEFFEQPLANPGAGGDTCSMRFDLSATPSLGLGQWSKLAGPGLVSFLPADTVPDALASVSQAGIYTFLWVETSGICISAASVTVIYSTPPTVDPGAGGMVCGLTFGLNAVPSLGTGSWSLQSGPGSALFVPSINTPNASVTVSESGTYEFLWTESDAICSSDSAVTVSFLDLPVARAGTGGETCGPDFQLSAIPGLGTGSWTQTGGPGTAIFAPTADSPDAMVTVDMPGIYQFTWTETNGICPDQDSIEVNFLENLILEAGPEVQVCGLQHGLTVQPQDIPGRWINNYGPGVASFSPSETDPAARITVDAHGAYLFTWEVRQGFCTGEDSVRVVFNRLPIANAGPDQVLEFTFSTYLEAVLPSADLESVNATGAWSLLRGSGLIADPQDPATRVTELKLGENVFQWALFSDICPTVSDEVIITVSDIETYTVITPNNDGLNDVLVFPGLEDMNDCEIIIYNRWGKEVYRNDNYQNNWEGKDHKERLLISDTYYYVLKIPPDRVIKSFVEIRRSQ